MTTLRLAVVSDIHAYRETSDETYVVTEPPPSRRNEQPVADLLRFVEGRGLQADYVVCPGDLSDQADDPGKLYAWNQLHELARRLGAGDVLAAPGNHDLTTYTQVADPAATLKNLEPPYPTGERSSSQQFWDEGFVILDRADHRFLITDSCRGFPPHPGSDCSDEEFDAYKTALSRGSFPEDLQDRIEAALSTLDERPINIALCHHHPVEHERRELFKDSYGPMHRGEQLLRILEDNYQCGRWLVIHGHKHVPQLIGTAGASANGPVLLCSASTGGKLWHPVVSATRNQFHIVSLDRNEVAGLARLRGTITSYSWGFGTGWDISGRKLSGLPGHCGFGMSHDHRDLAASMLQYLSDRALEFASWSEVTEALPVTKYQGPQDQEMLEHYLLDLGLVLVRDSEDHVLQLGRAIA